MRIRTFLGSAAVLALATVLAAPVPALANDARLKLELGDLAASAKESVNITVDKNTIEWAAKAIGEKGGNEAELRQLMKELDGIYVQVLEFDEDKAPAWAELQKATKGVLAKLDGPGWTSVVAVTEHGEDGDEIVRISLFTDQAGNPGGLAIFALEPTEVALINIAGPVKLEQLGRIGAALGKPGMFGPMGGDEAAKPAKKKDKAGKKE